MITLYRPNAQVGGGTYLNLKAGDFVNIPREGGALPGPADVKYLKVPALGMLVLGPALGLLFVLFLPMAVPLVLLAVAAKKLGIKAEGARETAIRMTVPAQVGVAAVHRAAGQEGDADCAEATAEIDGLIDRLEQEIAERRRQGE